MLKLKKNPSLKPKRSNFFVLAKVFVLALFCSAALAEVLQIKLKPGAQDFSFSLPANPTTGYHWSVVSYDQTLMQLKSAQYHAKTGNLIGRGGVMTYHFVLLQPKQKLQAKIILRYARPWEQEAGQTQTVDVSSNHTFFNLFKW